jgi:hypothetical protein
LTQSCCCCCRKLIPRLDSRDTRLHQPARWCVGTSSQLACCCSCPATISNSSADVLKLFQHHAGMTLNQIYRAWLEVHGLGCNRKCKRCYCSSQQLLASTHESTAVVSGATQPPACK